MAYFAFITVCLSVVALVMLCAARVGYRGQVCDREVGYAVPARVESDPRLAERANRLVARWCTVGGVLAVLPLVPLTAAISSGVETPSLPVVLALAGYTFVVMMVGSYPFEKIKQLAEEQPGR